jgi:hypothetical protein
VGGGTDPPVSDRSALVEGGRDEAEELVRFVKGLKVDAASLRGLEASLFTREGVSVPGAGCDMMGYFRCMICYDGRYVYDRCRLVWEMTTEPCAVLLLSG